MKNSGLLVKQWHKKVCSVSLLLLVSVYASAYDFENEGIFYNILSLTDKTVEVTYESDEHYHVSYKGEVNIPSIVVYKGQQYSVVKIGEGAFMDQNITRVILPSTLNVIGAAAFHSSKLAEIKIPNAVTTIDGSAFEMCHELTEISIPASVVSIGSSFAGCSNLTKIEVSNENPKYCSIDGVLFNKSVTKLIQYPGGKTESYTIPSTVTDIEDYAFAWSGGLNNITIPNSVTNIGSYAFFFCDLAKIMIPNSVTRIGDYSFAACPLIDVFVPNSVVSIGEYAFDSNSLKKVAYPDKIQDISLDCEIKICYPSDAFIAHNGVVYSEDLTKLYYVPPTIDELLLCDDVISIEKGALALCSNLTNIDIPKSVSTIGEYAFYGCGNLTNISISESVTSIEAYAFYGCSNFTNIDIPKSVSTIGEYAFYGCSNLTNISISESVTSIEAYAFYGCSNLTNIDIPRSVSAIGEYAFADCSNITHVTLSNNGNAVIGCGAFQNCIGITELTIPQNLWKIGDKAFNGCTNLLKLNYNAINCTSCGKMSFPSNIRCLNLGSSVYKIPANAFYNCSELTEVIIPRGVVNVGDGAFYNCSGIKMAACPSGTKSPFRYGTVIHYPNTGIIDPNNIIYNADMTEIYYVPLNVEIIHLPDGLTDIKYESFKGCANLYEVTIPNSVINIESSAFSDCYNLKEISIPLHET